jgi:hypothetical protein
VARHDDAPQAWRIRKEKERKGKKRKKEIKAWKQWTFDSDFLGKNSSCNLYKIVFFNSVAKIFLERMSIEINAIRFDSFSNFNS